MKLTVIILLTACLATSATGLTQTVTLTVKNTSLEKVFSEIEKQTGYYFAYTREEISKAAPVTIDVKNAKLTDVLNLCFKNQPLTYIITNNVISVKPKEEKKQLTSDNSPLTIPPPIDIHGKIVNEKGEPVAASVLVKGTNNGTSTNDNGEFELKGISNDATLVISGVSIETFEVKVNGRSDLAIVNAKTKTVIGEEVKIEAVNTGYQKISKERFVGSYSQLDSAAYNRRAGMDIIDRLDGTVTGVLFDKKQLSGDLLSNVQIRGLSTLNSSKTPLLIVDDFPFTGNINSINQNDVESITVLKDAAAASIWGARAGNGVIVITTQKGKFNQPFRLSINSNVTVEEKPDLYYYPQMNVSDFIGAEQFLFNKGYYDAALNNTTYWPAVSPVVEMLARRRSGKISGSDSMAQIVAFQSMDLRRDMDKYVYRKAIRQQHFLSLSAGTNLIAYNFSAGYNKNSNNIKNSKPGDEFTLNSNVKLRPTKNLEITNEIRYFQSFDKSSTINMPGKVYPYMQLADAEGNALPVPDLLRLSYLDTVGNGKLLDWKFRPLDEIKLADRTSNLASIFINADISYKFANWLSAAVGYQYSNQTTSLTNYESVETYSTRNMINQFTNLSQATPALRNPVPVGGILDEFHSSLINHNARGRLDFNKNFARIHQVQAMLAADISQQTNGSSSNVFYNYNKETGTYQTDIDYVSFFPNLYTGGSSKISNGSVYRPSNYNRFVSFAGNLTYILNGLYTVYASARKDGSNVFGVNTNKKWKPLWSAGISWDISKEKFYSVRWMPSLRLRASYGFAGNPGPPTVTGFPILEYSSIPAYITNLPYASPNGAPNPDLRWEKVRTINGGVDFGLFASRVTGSIDIWQKKSTDLIATVPFAPATGVTYFTTNFANLKGNGFDINLRSKNIDREFKWESNFGLSHAKTIVTKLFDSRIKARDFIDYAINPTEGQLAYGLSSFRWGGLDPLTGDPQGIYNKQVSSNYVSIINDSLSNQVFHGSSIPLYFGFLSNSFSWKNFSISANITYRLDFYFRKPTLSYSQLAINWLGNYEYASRWQKPGDEKITNVPSFAYPLSSDRDFFYQYSEINVLRGDNVRLQDIRLQYGLNKSQLKKIPFNSLQLYLYVNNLNLILWRKAQSEWDPDFIGATKIISAPVAKAWTIGVNLNL